ncbi:MAG: GNAT family N-acetyltransferase [Alphaproteobacteria bacterium]
MKIVNFAPEHLGAFLPQRAQFDVSPYLANARNSIAAAFAQGPALSGVIDGRIVGAAGVRIDWPGAGTAWALLSEEVLRRPASLLRACARGLDEIEHIHGLRRIQASVAVGHAGGHRFLAALGFEVEGLLGNYGFGGMGDYILYARKKP